MKRPRVLITGFGPFPGAPVNPTEALVRRLGTERGNLSAFCDIRTAVLPVEYAAVPDLLAELGRHHSPDIAIHFGLSAEAEGFTLERLARNEIAAGKPDNAGGQPGSSRIVEGGQGRPASLPLGEISARLEEAGLPWSWSDDAGGYLCNYVFYLSCSPHFTGLSAPMSGFVHVPLLAGEGANALSANAMPLDDMITGARLIVETCVIAWRRL
ncbi:MAG: peptidase C15 [Rhizobiales bacterium]|nr:peptidase C15 [Hyphomicrobiales bacterium]MBA68703.1 peptidase C15 [Hyphomicrobiales bacterium]